MDTQQTASEEQEEGKLPLNPLHAAAIVGGALAASAGAYFGARALARRNGGEGKVNSVLAAAITACEVSHKPDEPEPEADKD